MALNLRAEPRYLPHGYIYAWARSGESAGGFWGVADQAVAVYTPGTDSHDPLFIYSTRDPRAELIGTESRAGEKVDLGTHGTGIYHDGLWKLGPGHDQQAVGDLVLHWDAGNVHSLRFRSGGLLFAVRGSRTRGVTRDELVKVARSLAVHGVA